MINPQPLQSPSVQPQTTQPSGLTELVLTQHSAGSWLMVMPMIAHLSRQGGDRWLTWLTQEPVPAKILQEFGVDTSRLRLVHCKSEEEQLWVCWDALALGNSHTVIANPGSLTKQALAQLEKASQIGQSQGLLIRER
ncbi:cell division inhibitor SulA [Gilvimarinus xylanilyticus]|uniref:Cell division inhibitor n=1 Tax=Gilvimarinus xylanilyticus TaxID=2944139 RepID=A0A9X2KSG8_9GAMM|nr:hypothetical protein [Gilvimarinus xylanilyticus]